MSQQISLLDLIHKDVCQRRHGGNPLSVEAHSRVIHTKEQTYRKILEYIQKQGEHGATSKEIALALGYGAGVNKISGRLSEMRYSDPPRLKDSEMRRGGAAVLVLV